MDDVQLGEEVIEWLVEDAARGVEGRCGVESQSASQATQSQDQGGGGGWPRRQVATAWPQVNDVNRLTREKPELFEIEQFNKHL